MCLLSTYNAKKMCLVKYFCNILLKLKTQNWMFGMGIFFFYRKSVQCTEMNGVK